MLKHYRELLTEAWYCRRIWNRADWWSWCKEWLHNAKEADNG